MLGDISAVAGVAVAAIATLVVPATRWAIRTAVRDAIDRSMQPDGALGREITAVHVKLDSVDKAVNQSTGKRLTDRVDEIAAQVGETRGEVRLLRVELREEFAGRIITAAAVLHPELSADQIIELAGDHPDLSIEQARQMRAQRLPPRSHDNPEEHP